MIVNHGEHQKRIMADTSVIGVWDAAFPTGLNYLETKNMKGADQNMPAVSPELKSYKN